MIESSLPQSDVSLPPFGRRARSVAGYGVGTALMMITPLLVFVPAALYHCALRNGRRAAWLAFAIATGLTALYSVQVANVSAPGTPVMMAYALFLGMVLSVGLPAVMSLPLVEREEKFGTIVVFAVGASAIGLGLTETLMRVVANFSPYAAHMAQWQEQTARFPQIWRSMNAPADFIRNAQVWIRYVSEIIPSLFLTEVALVFVLSLMMYGRLRAWRLAGAAATEVPKTYLFRNFALPEWLIFAFVFGGLTPITSGMLQKVAANVLAAVVFLYLLQGLAIFRAMIASSGVGVFGATIAIITLAMLIVTMGVGVVLLVVAGLFDPFFDFRKLKRKDDSHEGHTD